MLLVESLVADHRKLQSTMARVSRFLFGDTHGYFARGRSPEDTSAVLAMLKGIIRDLRRHEAREGGLLFPRALRSRPSLAATIRELEADHLRTRALLGALERTLSPGEAAPNRVVIERFLKLSNHISRHMLREERELFGAARSLAQRRAVGARAGGS